MKKFKDYILESGLGKGYIGNSMSVNAKEAYDNDEMPLSKWTKFQIENVLYGLNDKLNIKKFPLNVLKRALLEPTHKHHTSAFFNYTDFYKIKDEVKNWTQKDLEEEMDFYSKYGEKKEKKERNKSNDEKVDELFSKMEYIMDNGIVKYKYFSGMLNLLKNKGLKEINKLFEKAVKNSKEEFEIKKHNRNSKDFKYLEFYVKIHENE